MENNTEYVDVETVVLEMQDGSEKEFAIIEVFDYNDKEYAILSYVENDEITEDSILVEYQENGDEVIVTIIEDDDEYEKVADYYDNMDVE